MTVEEAVEYALTEEEQRPLPRRTHAPKKPPSSKQPDAVLTRREQEVALLVARGLTNRQIAEELSVSERTVDTHVGRILKKLGLRSREQVADRLGEQRHHQAG